MPNCGRKQSTLPCPTFPESYESKGILWYFGQLLAQIFFIIVIVWSDSLYFYPLLLASAPWPDKNWSILEAEVPDVANNHQCFDQVFVEFPDFYLRSISHQGPLWKGTGKTGKLLLVESFQLGRFLLREKYYSEKMSRWKGWSKQKP